MNRRLPASVRAMERQSGEHEPSKARGRALSKGAHALAATTATCVRRVATRLLRVGAVLVAIGGAIAAGRLVEKWVRTSPAFAVRTVEVRGNERLTRDEVVTAAGVVIGRNVFDVPPDEAQARVQGHPWVAAASVRRRLPGAYEITVRERRAVAAVAAGPRGRLYLVDENGSVFERLDPGDPTDLPVVTGVQGAELVRRSTATTHVLSRVANLLREWDSAGLGERDPLAEVHVEPDEGLSVYAGVDNAYVRCGRGPYGPKLLRLTQVIDLLAARGARPAYVYLDDSLRPERVTVRIRDVVVQEFP